MSAKNMYSRLLLFMIAALVLVAGNGNAMDSNTTLYDQEMLRLGERMYRDGKLPSGEPMQGFIRGDIAVDSTAFSCVSCHLRGGLGSIEGGVLTPPTNGSKLFQPYYSGTILTSSPKAHRNHYVLTPTRRPAYTRETLASALRGGVNPAGRQLHDVMPRYHLQDRDMAILINYLQALSANISPGVDTTTLRLATVISDGVSLENRKAMLEPLENFVALKNSQAKVYAARTKYMAGGGFPEELNLAYRKLSLARWELKGRPETWRLQLEERYRQEPVFAFVGGITTEEWQPIHDFCEEHKIPCLFPVTAFPVISASDWYTLYFSKGIYQEGEAAARFLANGEKVSPEGSVVQIVGNSPESRRLSAGFMNTWHELGKKPPLTVTLPDHTPPSREFLQEVVTTYQPAAVLLWTGPEILPALEQVARDFRKPTIVIVSSGYLQKEIWNLPQIVREFTYITYPYRLPQETSPATGTGSTALHRNGEPTSAQRISTMVQAMTEVLQLGFMHMNRNFYRDTLLDVISMIPDQKPHDYDRFSFGPGQRYASKGANIVQLSSGTDPVLEKKGDWVMH